MTPATESCLARKLGYYIDIDPGVWQVLSRLEKEESAVPARTTLLEEGDDTRRLYVVKRGWLYSARQRADGRRQIYKLHHPGDVIGFPDIAYSEATGSLHTATDVVVCPFPKATLQIIFARLPRIAALMFTLAVRDQVTLIDLLQAMGRMSARERLAYFLLEIHARLKITNTNMADTFRMPLTQTDIGDMLGLTNVYVSKTFTALEQDGLIRRDGGRITLRALHRLEALCDFEDRHASMDVGWFPGTTEPSGD